MAKAKRHQNTAKSLSSLQTLDSYSILTGDSPALAPGEDAGVCVVCEDECTCGAARGASSSTIPPPAPVRRIVLTLPRRTDSDSNKFPGSLSVEPVAGSLVNTSNNPRTSAATPSVKKRGRPSKADLDARQAAARAARASAGAIRRGPSANSIKYQRTGGGSSGLSRPSIISAPSDLPTSTGYPTFVSASVFGGSDSSLSSPSEESDSSDSSSSDDSIDDDDETDSEVEAEEERLIVEETLAMRKLRTRRELENALDADNNGGGNGGRRRWDKKNWNNREHRGSMSEGSGLSSAGDDSSSDDSDSDGDGSSGDDEQEDDDVDDPDIDVDAEPSRLPGAGWSDEDEDADLFFANLSDSSFDSSSSDSESEHPPNRPDQSTEHVATESHPHDSQLAAPLPLVVAEDWNGQLVFTDGMKDGQDLEMLDLILNAALAASGAAPGDLLASDVDGTDDLDEHGSLTEDLLTSEDDEDYEGLSQFEADGDTTDEDELHPELGPILFANSPFTLAMASKPVHRLPKIKSSKVTKEVAANPRVTPALSLSSTSSSGSNRLIPVLGSFILSTELNTQACTAIIDGSRSAGILPSPYPRSPGRRKEVPGPRSGTKRRAVVQNPETDASRSPKRVRQTTRSLRTPSPSARSPPPIDPLASEDTVNEPDSEIDGTKTPSRSLPPPTPIDLDDVLYTDHLSDDNDDSDGTAIVAAHRSRWDRIPINAFHRLRSATYSHAGALGSPVSTTVTRHNPTNTPNVIAIPQSPRPADGFSYGSTPSVVSPYARPERKSYFSYDHHASPRPRATKPRSYTTTGHSRRNSNASDRGRPTEREKRRMLLSPIILPVKEEGRELVAKKEPGASSDMDWQRSPSLPPRPTTSHGNGHSRSKSTSLVSPTPFTLDK